MTFPVNNLAPHSRHDIIISTSGFSLNVYNGSVLSKKNDFVDEDVNEYQTRAQRLQM